MHAHMDFQSVNCNRSRIAQRSARAPATDLPTGKQNRRHIVIRGNTAIVSVIASSCGLLCHDGLQFVSAGFS
jgi:hypothetical protein